MKAWDVELAFAAVCGLGGTAKGRALGQTFLGVEVREVAHTFSRQLPYRDFSLFWADPPIPLPRKGVAMTATVSQLAPLHPSSGS